MVILFDLVSISDLNLHPCNLFQHTCMLVLPEINFLHLLLPVTLLLVGGWMTPTPSQGPPIPQGGGGLMGYDHDHGRGGGGGTRNLEHIYVFKKRRRCIYNTLFSPCFPVPKVQRRKVGPLLCQGGGAPLRLEASNGIAVSC